MTSPRVIDYAPGQGETDAALTSGSPYIAYTYSYPHKTSYRPFEEPVRLRDLWANEDRHALFLYLHIPFCEMRCGFCNLFTYAKPEDDYASRYVRVLRRQAEVVREELGSADYARLAIGGGTPTQLDERGLVELFSIIEDVMGCDPERVPVSVEMSPETVTASKLAILREHHVDRASIGIQSFIREETKALRRPQDPAVAHGALELMREAGFPTVNVDLIYGIRGQTVESWTASIEEALRHEPEELYLYPLYVRPKTGLGNSPREWDDERLAQYRAARDLLSSRGYEQVSMRMFRRRDAPDAGGPAYCCQADGMVGLGTGARSYTDAVHYCTEYAVGRRGVREILDDFVTRDDDRHAYADYGFILDVNERRRRHLILSLLTSEGLDERLYASRFAAGPFDHFPELHELLERGLAERDGALTKLTPSGLERTDVLGPWLYSSVVRERMREFELR